MALENYANYLDQFDPMKADQAIETLRGAQTGNKLANINLLEKQREISDAQKLNENYRNALGANGKFDQGTFEYNLLNSGLGPKLPEIRKKLAEQEKLTAETAHQNASAGKAKAETSKIDRQAIEDQFELSNNIASAWAINPTVTKADIERGLNAAYRSKIISPEAYNAKMEELKPLTDDAPTLNDWGKRTVMQVMKSKDLYASQYADGNAQLNANTSIRNTDANNATSAANNAANNAVQRDKMAIDKKRDNKGKIIQTDQGTILVDDVNATATPVTMDGKPLQPKANTDTGILASSISSMDRLALAAKEARDHPGLAGTAGLRGTLPNIPGSDAADAAASLSTLKSQVAFGVLQDMRNNSKTGGALGSVSDAEGKRLEANLAALEKSQSVEQLRSNLDKILKYTDEAKTRLRDVYDSKYKPITKNNEASSGVNFETPTTVSGKNRETISLLQQELAQASNPEDKAALQRSIDRLNKAKTTTTPTKTNRPSLSDIFGNK